MNNSSANLDRDAQQAGGLDDVLAQAIEQRLKSVHTGMPGVIASYDAVKRTCSVQPGIQRVFDGVPTNLPLLVDCPIWWPQGGGFVLTFPLAAGDDVWISWAERSIDNWYQAGGQQPPGEYRMHDLSDGFVFPGLAPQTHPLPNTSTSAVELRNWAGTQRVSLGADGSITNTTSGGSTVLSAGGAFTVNGTLTVNGASTFNGNQAVNGDEHVTGTVTGDTDVKSGLISLRLHKTSGVTPGAGVSLVPVP